MQTLACTYTATPTSSQCDAKSWGAGSKGGGGTQDNPRDPPRPAPGEAAAGRSAARRRLRNANVCCRHQISVLVQSIQPGIRAKERERRHSGRRADTCGGAPGRALPRGASLECVQAAGRGWGGRRPAAGGAFAQECRVRGVHTGLKKSERIGARAKTGASVRGTHAEQRQATLCDSRKGCGWML